MIKKSWLKPFIANNSILWTPVAILMLIILPVWYLCVVAYEERDDLFKAFDQVIDLLLWRVEE